MSIKRSLRTRGVIGTIQFGIQKILGISHLQDQINTLYFFLNKCEDITTLKPGAGDIRKMQLAMLQLMRVFDKLCKKHNLDYWLDAGTLLGAIRHKGFIPWDDDVDVTMPREDYEKVLPLMKKELEPYGIIVGYKGYFDDEGYMSRLFLDYRAMETGVWLDIFPMDYCNASGSLVQVKDDLSKAVNKYRKYYLKAQKKDSIEDIKRNKSRIFGEYKSLNDGSHKVLFRSCEFNELKVFVDYDMIFPLREAQYEACMFPVPNKAEEYLDDLYKGYLEFPKGGIESHLDPDGGKASERARKHGIDMDEVILYLKQIADSI